jgi:hypothetical protein
MKQQLLPRLADQGFVPALNGRRIPESQMLIPRPKPRAGENQVLVRDALLLGELGPPERRALREIVETAEVVSEGRHRYLVARVSSETIDALAAFEAGREDLEPDGSDEPQTDRLHDEVEPDSDDDWGYR